MQVPSVLVAKSLRLTVFVRDRVTGDTLPVTVASSQPAPLELQPGTTTFSESGSLIPAVTAQQIVSDTSPAAEVNVTLANVPVDENVCCIVEITDASTLALLSWCVMLLLLWFVSHLTSQVVGAACPFMKRTRCNQGLRKDPDHPLRSQSEKLPKQVMCDACRSLFDM